MLIYINCTILLLITNYILGGCICGHGRKTFLQSQYGVRVSDSRGARTKEIRVRRNSTTIYDGLAYVLPSRLRSGEGFTQLYSSIVAENTKNQEQFRRL